MNLLVDDLIFPEAPRWRGGRLYFSDFFTHRVTAVDLAGRTETIAEVPGQPSGLGFLPDGSLLAVSMLDRRVVRVAEGKTESWADLSAIATGEANDMIVDAHGRAYVGNKGFDRWAGEPFRAATLALVQPDGTVEHAADDLAFPNGMAITSDGGTLIVAETLANRLTMFDIDGAGRLAHRRLFADLGAVSPDGICLDAEGACWVAHPQGDAVLRVAEGGAILDRVETGARGSFACALGGEDGRTLFVCTNDLARVSAGRGRDGRVETARVAAPAQAARAT